MARIVGSTPVHQLRFVFATLNGLGIENFLRTSGWENSNKSGERRLKASSSCSSSSFCIASAASFAAWRALPSLTSKSAARECTRNKHAAASERAHASSALDIPLSVTLSAVLYSLSESSSFATSLLSRSAARMARRSVRRLSSPVLILSSQAASRLKLCRSLQLRGMISFVKFVRAKSRNSSAVPVATSASFLLAASRTTFAAMLLPRACALMASSERRRQVSMACSAAKKASSRCTFNMTSWMRPLSVSPCVAKTGFHGK
mmetsp:Transcript_9781/g.25673  ORF Transcript_9781/g.25673 Transcript_9781/m.25673 type:complete len:262 (+) Transcript_9781:2269-3054(+)